MKPFDFKTVLTIARDLVNRIIFSLRPIFKMLQNLGFEKRKSFWSFTRDTINLLLLVNG